MKRNKRQRNYKTTTTTELDYMRVIKISVGVLLVLAIVLIGSKIAMGEIKFGRKDSKEEVTTIDYQEIMAGQTFNRKADEYYVLFYSFSDSNATYYTSAINNYKLRDTSSFYTVDLDKKNNKVYAEEELEVEDPTIIKVSDGKSVDVIKGKDAVKEFFNN